MVTTSQTHLARSWREAARKGTGNGELYRYLKSGISPQMYQVMRRQIAENAMLISNTPYNIAYYVVNEIQEQYMGGNRPAGVLEMLMEQFPLASRNRVKLIARTEIGKASTTLTMAQAFDIGAEWYLWSTSEDQRVRSSHRHMEDVIVNFNDPPSPEALIGEKSYGKYHAGNIWNCRCFCAPVIDFDHIVFPHKVYIHGQIYRMSKTQFRKAVA